VLYQAKVRLFYIEVMEAYHIAKVRLCHKTRTLPILLSNGLLKKIKMRILFFF